MSCITYPRQSMTLRRGCLAPTPAPDHRLPKSTTVNQFTSSKTLINQFTAHSKRDRIAGLEFEMIKVAPSRLGSVTEADGRRIGTLGRVVMDAIFDSSRFGTLPKAYGWIRDRRENEGFLNELVDCCIRHADAPTRRRVGCVLELLEAGGKRLDKLHKKTPKTRSVIPLVPGSNRIGTINKRWGVILNQTDWLHEADPDRAVANPAA